jgi:hypothetical protein
MKKGKNVTKDKGAKTGYWLYKNGSSFWGIGVQKSTEIPIPCTKELHKKTVEDKIKFYKEKMEKKNS